MQTKPSLYKPEIADEILARLAAGESLRGICKAKRMPAESTVRLWAVEDREGFSARYLRARDMGLDCMADELLEIADKTQVGTKTKEGPDGVEVTRADMIEHRRLRVDARKWYLSKLAPKRFGDRLSLAGDSDAPLQVVINKPA